MQCLNHRDLSDHKVAELLAVETAVDIVVRFTYNEGNNVIRAVN